MVIVWKRGSDGADRSLYGADRGQVALESLDDAGA